ncbi:hypothetical protein [Nostoc sp. FACHB-888]|uniref:hypothetical protein n=1 Tax=Nostoc sp. FACHB-888 TaxID=2692842 RepID=UPI0016859313|nr:hypothetical protein [Nostoc sp. FACHB-888]MBD2247795.1 hypothetical protein [Nostoc sp. FACHB-888]
MYNLLLSSSLESQECKIANGGRSKHSIATQRLPASVFRQRSVLGILAVFVTQPYLLLSIEIATESLWLANCHSGVELVFHYRRFSEPELV